MELCTFVATACTFEAPLAKCGVGKPPEDDVIPCTFEAYTNNN